MVPATVISRILSRPTFLENLNDGTLLRYLISEEVKENFNVYSFAYDTEILNTTGGEIRRKRAEGQVKRSQLW